MHKYSKYQTLLNVLDKISLEAPIANKFYRPKNDEKFLQNTNNARSRSLIHLYLKSQFWLINFKDREVYVTDGPYDGWIDWYYIDENIKKIYIIQAKFRTNKSNFEEKEITFEELLKMDISRIIDDGEKKDEDGKNYNWKILWLQRKITEIRDIGRYKYEVVLLANLHNKIKTSQLTKLTGWFTVEKFNFEKIYSNLIFPFINWTYYNENELLLELNLSNTYNWASHIDYSVELEWGEVSINVLFVPTIEIAKALYMYKNSILKYNPRSYLEMRQWHVNKDIYDSIVDKKSNEFSLFNNWITILSRETDLNKKTAKKHNAQLIIDWPQIINWGQTSYTLSWIYEKVLNNELPEDVFSWKDVLIKVITLEKWYSDESLDIIEAISKATNNQSLVTWADRKSNEKVQIDIQKNIFENFGLFYERKKGEFSDGILNKYIDKDALIKREIFLKMSLCSQFPSKYIWDSDIEFKNPKNTTETWLFSDQIFRNILSYEKFDLNRSIYNYFIYNEIKLIKKKQKEDIKDKDGISRYWNVLRYGEIALIMINCFLNYKEDYLNEDLNKSIIDLMGKWKDFEIFIQNKSYNNKYFNKELQETNFIWYYKSNNLLKDLKEYFIKAWT